MSFSLELFESRGEIPGAIVREKRGRKLETVFFFFFFPGAPRSGPCAVWSLSEHDRKGIKAGDTLNLA